MVSFVLAAALTFTPADAKAAYAASSNLVSTCTPRDAGTLRAYKAARFIRDAASAAGLDARMDVFHAETPRGEKRFSNVEAEYRSGAGRWIVLVSHFDTKSGTGCPGANDGASTTGLLIALAGSAIRCRPRGADILFVWTDGEECMESYSANDGLWGSKRAAARLKESGRDVAAVICVDMLGDRDLEISIPKNVSKGFGEWTKGLSESIGLGGKVALSPNLVKDDHVPFLEQGFKAIDLIDFDYGPQTAHSGWSVAPSGWWHTPEDTMDKISEESLLAAGRLVAAMVDGLSSSAAAGDGSGKRR